MSIYQISSTKIITEASPVTRGIAFPCTLRTRIGGYLDDILSPVISQRR